MNEQIDKELAKALGAKRAQLLINQDDLSRKLASIDAMIADLTVSEGKKHAATWADVPKYALSTVPEAIVAFLGAHPNTSYRSRRIADTLQEGGIRTSSDNFPMIVHTACLRLVNKGVIQDKIIKHGKQMARKFQALKKEAG